ncbi:hypothetical protein IH992_02510 [Candidatus Poribacteria bacterium]|nr:hypothetical protein [Candidatus Poribacteria bacterium]
MRFRISTPQPATLYKKVPIPDEFISVNADGQRWGGDIRIGDLTGDGNVDFLVYKSLGGIKPCFLGAFTLDGEPIWSVGNKDLTAMDADSEDILQTTSPDRPGPVAIYDIDQDGTTEVICFLIDFDEVGAVSQPLSRWNLEAIDLVILDGKTGEIKRHASPAELRQCNAYVDGELHLSNYVHHRLMIANFTGNSQPQDFVVKLGNDILAFNHELEILWQYTNRWYRYSKHAAYIPAVGDLDGDGRDEVNGGHFGLDHDGNVLWEKYLGDNMDAVLVEEWDGDQSNGKEAILSGGGQVLDGHGNTLLELGMELVPHGQEIRYGNLRLDTAGPELVIRYNGHHPDLMVVSHSGEVLSRFQADESPNNTGLEIIHWNGENEADLIYSPAALYDGYGNKVVTFPNLPPPTGGKMGWYHCFPANVCGDEREEVILYDPHSDAIYVYTPPPFDATAFRGYKHTPRQYNARLID